MGWKARFAPTRAELNSSRPRRGSRTGRALAAAVVVSVVAVAPAGAVLAAPATRVEVAVRAADTSGLKWESHAVYTVDLAAHVVHVGDDMSLTNTMPDRRVGSSIEVFYFNHVSVPVVSEAANAVATRSDGHGLTVSKKPTDSPLAALFDIALSPALYYGKPQTIHLSYDLPDQPPRAAGVTRVNAAFAEFVAWSVGDPSLTSVQLRIPDGLKVETVGADDLKQTEESGQQVYTATAIADPDTWSVAVVARDDSKLASRNVEVLHHPVVIRSWPGDQPWSTFVDTTVTDGMPALAQLIGLPWPDTLKDLNVTETAAPYLYGYAGWYTPSENSIEIGDALDPHVVLHEMSHLWFNSHLFTARWINEGLAEEFSSQAQKKLGEPMPNPDPVKPGDPNHFDLLDWPAPELQTDTSEATERFGYSASWTVMRAITDEIGTAGLAKVLAAANNRSIAYVGAGKAETVDGASDWRRLLDLFEEVGGSKKADALFSTWVVGNNQVQDFIDRKAARETYAKLEKDEGALGAPYAVRLAMSDWSFTTAERLMKAAETVLGLRADVVAEVKPIGLSAPVALTKAYESSTTTLAPAIQKAKDELAAGHLVVTADHDVHASHGLIAKIGLWGGADKSALNSARSAFVAGDTTSASADARHAIDIVEGASTAGEKRIGEIVGVIVVIALALFMLRRGLVKRDRAAAAARAAAPATDPYGIGTLYAGSDSLGSTSAEPAVESPTTTATATEVLEPPPDESG